MSSWSDEAGALSDGNSAFLVLRRIVHVTALAYLKDPKFIVERSWLLYYSLFNTVGSTIGCSL